MRSQIDRQLASLQLPLLLRCRTFLRIHQRLEGWWMAVIYRLVLSQRLSVWTRARINQAEDCLFGARRDFCRPRWLNEYSPVPAPWHDEPYGDQSTPSVSE
ncbi:uncharacterized protein ARMOST_08524 [Armillaria ostoyae]|uniref:Uncharacterized protein n=1 Tax=Armillaria ostoyae TaxID=47428 RepID=A0A284R8U4_ARMOS|nr:uncharacterized protein ARMOST_08524 [Armillaria ostoyae]